jgi:hypothetical protein
MWIQISVGQCATIYCNQPIHVEDINLHIIYGKKNSRNVYSLRQIITYLYPAFRLQTKPLFLAIKP